MTGHLPERPLAGRLAAVLAVAVAVLLLLGLVLMDGPSVPELERTSCDPLATCPRTTGLP